MKEHISLYRKWRPKTFDEIVGQTHITQTLTNAFREERLSHAYLFCGPRGTGKTTTARILAKAVNCEKGPTPTPCNSCSSCTEIEDTVSGDVLEIDAASNRGIDEIRNLRESVSFAPARGQKRVYIIDEVHMLTPEAFNAFLKTLEEPPEHVIFILATTEPHRVPATIHSRCQRFDFRQIAASDMTAHLNKVAASEGVEVDQAVHNLICRQAKGSLRDALGILEQLASFSGEKIALTEALSFLGLIDTDLLFEITDAVRHQDTARALLFVEELADKGRDLRQFVKEWQEHLRHLLLVLQAEKESAMDIIASPPEIFTRLESQAQDFEPLEVARYLEILREAGGEMRFDDPRLALELAMVKMTKLGKGSSLDGVLYRLSKVEEQLKAQSKEAAPVSEMSVEAEERAPVLEKDRVGDESVEKTAKTTDDDEPAEAPTSKAGTSSKESVSVPDVADQGSEGKDESGQAASADTESPPQPGGGGVVDLARIERVWPEFMKRVKAESIPVHALLLEASPVSHDGETLILGFPARAAFHKGRVEEEASICVIEQALRDVVGLSLQFRCVLVDNPVDSHKVEAKEDVAQKEQPKIDPGVSSKVSEKGQDVGTSGGSSESKSGAGGDSVGPEEGIIDYIKDNLGAEVVEDAREGGSQ